jgi:RimJ/RimL family protein N-acetyltransferase
MSLVIETERLLLREIIPEDVDNLFILDSDPEVHRYLGNRPMKRKQEAEAVIEFIRQQYRENGIGRWAVVEKENNQFLGWAGLKYVTEPMNGHIYYYDLGYRLIRSCWGSGIATEAAIASRNYAFTVLKINTLYASAHVDNGASNRILQKIGFLFQEHYSYENELVNWYKLENIGVSDFRIENI